MNNKFLIFIGLMLLSVPAFAGLGDIGTQLTNAVSSSVSSWTNAFSSSGVFIFYVLATVELVMVFGMQALRGDLDFGAIMANLIRLTLIFGFWMMLLGTFGISWMKTIPKSFESIASSASGVGISTDNMFSLVGEVYNKLWDGLSFWDNFAESLMLVLVGFIALIALILLGVKILTNLVFATLSVYMSSLFFAFGVFSLTRQWAINSIVNVLRYGAKYMAVLLMAGLGINLLNNAINTATGDMTTANIFVVLIFSFILYALAHGIENFIDGYFTGMGGGENTMGGGLAKAMALGAGIGLHQGGSNALSQVKAASAAAAMDTKSSGSSGSDFSSGGTAEQNGKGTEKTGNFKKSVASGALTAASVATGAAVGMVSGMVKGGVGVATHNAGQKSGDKAGQGANLIKAGAKKIGDKLSGEKSSEQNKEQGGLVGTISQGAGQGSSAETPKSSYVSGVPGASSGGSTSSKEKTLKQTTVEPNITKKDK